jgi:hypothetical protein
VNKLLLLVGASTRSQLRWAKQHIYLWLILAPMVVGMTFFTASRVAENLPSWQPSRPLIVALAIVVEALLIAISLSRASSELYHLRRAEAYFDALPISQSTHLNAAFIARLARTTAFAAIVLVAHARFAQGKLTDATSLIALALVVILTSLAEMFAAINWIHWNHKKEIGAATLASAVLLISAALGGSVIAVAFKPDYFSRQTRLWLFVSSAVWSAALYLIAYASHERWRASDMEYAKRLQAPNRLSLVSARLVARRFSPAVATQIARDLRLTLRAFSSAAYVVSAVAALWVVLMVVMIITGSLPRYAVSEGFLEATWRPESMAIKFACVFSTATIAAIVPVLVAYELPMMWLERATGVTGLDIMQAKLWYTRIVTLPAPILAWAAGYLTGKAPLVYGPLLFVECLLLWLLVSTIMGGLAFEIPNRPGIAIIVMLTIALAAGLFSSLLWLVTIIAYAQAKDTLIERGRHRAKYYLITEGD